MNVDLGIWSKLTKLVIALFVLAGLMLIGVWYYPVIKQNERIRKEIFRLDTQIQREEEQGRQLKASIDSLRHDPRAVERLARETFGLARTGEVVVVFTNAANFR